MRLLTDSQALQVQGPVCEPLYLIKLALDELMHISTRQEVDYDGQTWLRGNVVLERVTPDSATLRIWNGDYAHTMAALTGAYQRKPISIWWAYNAGSTGDYVESGYLVPGYAVGSAAAPAPILLFSGMVSAIPEIGEWLRIEASRAPPRGYPRWRIVPPIANHLAPSGAVLSYGGETYKVEARIK